MGEATRRVLRLFWSPRGLAEAALMVPTFPAVLLGFGGMSLALACLMSVMFAGFEEPYPNVNAYLRDAVAMIPGVLLIAVGLSAVLWIFLGVFAVMWSDNALRRADLIGLRALGMAVFFVLVPLVCWAPLGILAAPANDPALSIGGRIPPWMRSVVLRVLGSGWWGCLFLVAAALAWIRSLFRISEWISEDSLCRFCGYELSGLPSGLCPECGRARDDGAGEKESGRT